MRFNIYAKISQIRRGRGARSLKLTKCEFIPGFGEIVSSIYDLILVSFQTCSAFTDGAVISSKDRTEFLLLIVAVPII